MKQHYTETLQGLLDMGAKELSLTSKEAKAILCDYQTLKQLRQLAGIVPCEMCLIKGNHNIERDGSCRHKPMEDSHLTDLEVIKRLKSVIHVYKQLDMRAANL